MKSAIYTVQLMAEFFIYAFLLRSTSRIVQKATLSWTYAFLFTLLAAASSYGIALANLFVGREDSAFDQLLVGFLINLALGAWFIGARAISFSGNPVTPIGGVIIAACTWIAGLAIHGLLNLLTHLLIG